MKNLFFIRFKKSPIISLLFLKYFLIFVNKKGSLFYYNLKKIFSVHFFYNSNFIIASFFVKNTCNNFIRNNIIFLKWNIFNIFKGFIFGIKKRILIKGLGFKIDFFCFKNRNFINIKAGYSHRILLQTPISVNFILTKTNDVLLQNTNYIYLNLLINLIFMMRKQNVYKQKGFFNPSILFIAKPTKKKN